SKVWICPAQDERMTRYGVTYAFSISANLKKYTSQGRRSATEVWVWDNFTLKPGLSGFMGPFSGYTIPTAERFYPHRLDNRYRSVNDLFLDGHVAARQLPG